MRLVSFYFLVIIHIYYHLFICQIKDVKPLTKSLILKILCRIIIIIIIITIIVIAEIYILDVGELGNSLR